MNNHKSHRVRRGLAAAALMVAATVATGVLATEPAAAGTRRTVCADSLQVRSQPGGDAFAYLYSPQTIDVYYYSGDWAYGFAYGYVNRHGWVSASWLCGQWGSPFFP